MNIRSNPDTTIPAVTTGPLPSSRKIFANPDAAPAPDGAPGICPVPPMMTTVSSEAGNETGDDGSGDSSSPEASAD